MCHVSSTSNSRRNIYNVRVVWASRSMMGEIKTSITSRKYDKLEILIHVEYLLKND